jgi:hypothetical protein
MTSALLANVIRDAILPRTPDLAGARFRRNYPGAVA